MQAKNGTAGAELKATQFKFTQDTKDKLAIIQALAKYRNQSLYVAALIDAEYDRRMPKQGSNK